MTRGINRGRPLGGESPLTPYGGFSLVPEELIVEFGLRWYLFGGGDGEEIMVRFGWSTDRYFTELRSILVSGSSGGIDDHVAESMIAVCNHRVRMGR